MTVMTKSRLLEFLEARSQAEWVSALDEISSSIHPVDREATRIWFAFWPMELHQVLREAKDPAEIVRLMDLEGKWRIEEQIDSSVSFLFGAHYWRHVKRAILEEVEESSSGSLAETIRTVARKAAGAGRVDEALVLGIAAVGLMAFRQIGLDRLQELRDTSAAPPLLPSDPRQVLAARGRKSGNLLTFLKGVNRTWEVRWDERRADGAIAAINGQDIAMAGDSTGKDYRHLDYRRPAGPVPVECRVGSCGYCWIGVLAGREKLSPITPFERERLRYFGYDTVNAPDDPTPLVRLACQAQCGGDVTLAIAPWNGELSRRHDETRAKLGTA
jgi:ferredoxin